MQSFTQVFKKALFIMALCTVLIPSATHAAITKTVTAANEDPTVTIIAPNGGESFTEGQQITVRWSTVGIPATQKVGFDLYTNQDTIKGYTLFNVSGQDLFDNDGQETLVIPSIRNNFTNWNYGNYFKIKMAVDNPDITAVDYSDSTFSISSVVAPMPSIHVISPNSGESYIAGQQIPVTWESANLPASSLVDIVVQHHYPGGNGIAGANYAQNLTPDGTSNDGTQVVTLPTQFPSRPFGRYFKILVIAHPYALTNTVYDVSDNLFTITAPVVAPTPSITVVSPNGGEVFQNGQQMTIRWSTTNVPPSAQIQIGIRDTRYNPNIGQGETTIINTTNETQSYEWVVPQSIGFFGELNSSTYIIAAYVVGSNGLGFDLSDNTFTISPTTTCTTSPTPSIKVLSPNGGEVYVEGQSISVTWETCNILPSERIINLSLGLYDANNDSIGGVGLNNDMLINDGQETVILPSITRLIESNPSVFQNLNFGPHFKIQALSGNNINVVDNSDNFFTINSATGGRPVFPAGCTAMTRFSPTTGRSCGDTIAPVTIAAPTTVAGIAKAVFTRELKLGASGADVTALQNRLKTEGVYTSPITGYFGKMTQAALKKFQTKYGIPAVGAAGPRTLQVLNK